MAGKSLRFFEGLVIAAIILVLVQTFLEDLALAAGWSWPVRRSLLLAGFGFDIFFSLEFLIRFYAALSRGRAGRYMARERGWIDLLASVPLLLLHSGPAVAAVYLGGGAAGGLGGLLNVLKVAKAVRVTRILRLLRVLKIFKQLRYTSSPMVQRHAAKVATVAVTAMVFVVFFGTVAERTLQLGSTEELIAQQRSEAVRRLQTAESPAELRRAAERTPSLLLVKRGGQTLYTRHGNEEYRHRFGPEDYLVQRGEEGMIVFFSLLPQRAEYAGTNMLFFLLIVAVVLAVLLYYAPHFALTVSDPINVMRRGLAEPSYGLEVRIPREYAGDDVYRLARLYNERYLPLKERSQAREHERRATDLSLEDLKDLLEK